MKIQLKKITKVITSSVIMATLSMAPTISGAEIAAMKIAVVVPYSSNIRSIAEEVLNGIQLGFSQEGLKTTPPWPGVTRIEINADIWDDKANKDVAVDVAKNIVKGDISAVIGHFNSGTAIPASSIYELAKIPNISTAATNPFLTDRGYKYTFRTVADDFALAADLMTYLDSVNMGNFAFAVHDDTAYGEITVNGLLDGYKRANAKKNIQIFHAEDASNIDIKALSNAASDTEENIIFIGSMDLFAISLIEKLPSNKRWLLLGADGLLTQAVKKHVTAANLRVMGITTGSFEPINPSTSDFVVVYKEMFGVVPGIEAARAFDAASMLHQAFAAAQSSAPVKIAEAIRTISYKEGVLGPIEFDHFGNNKSRSGFVYEIKSSGTALKDVVLNGKAVKDLPFLQRP